MEQLPTLEDILRGPHNYKIILSASTWEPVENLISCPDLIDRFQRKVSPIPGANPFVLEHLEKTKKVHVKMLLGDAFI